MKKNKSKGSAAVLLIMIGMLCVCAGCSQQAEEADRDAETQMNTLGLEPDLTYAVPASIPGILVDQLGYLTNSKKVAIFRGETLPTEFSVVNADTGEVVYTGIVEQDITNRGTSQGDFTEVTVEGNYYLTADILGQSYSFEVGSGVYDALFQEACKKYYYNRCGSTLTEAYAEELAHNACHTRQAVLRENMAVSRDVSGGWHQDEAGSKYVASGSMIAARLLLSYELYGDVFTDTMGIPESGNGVPDILDEVRYEVEWLLRMQDEESGGVYSGVTVYNENAQYNMPTAYVEEITPEATAAFSMIMAKFSYLYQDYDTEYALTCLQASDRAWRYLDTNGLLEINQFQIQFAASTELYRATGYRTYRLAAEQFLNYYFGTYDIGEITDQTENDGTGNSTKNSTGNMTTSSGNTETGNVSMSQQVFLGSVTYISTKQTVNLELCSSIMKALMQDAEAVSEASRQSPYLAAGNDEQDNNDELLRNMTCLTVVDHIITNHEYETVIENYLHYFSGRNAQALSYLDHVGTRNYKEHSEVMGIMNQFDSNSQLILMIGEIINDERSDE